MPEKCLERLKRFEILEFCLNDLRRKSTILNHYFEICRNGHMLDACLHLKSFGVFLLWKKRKVKSYGSFLYNCTALGRPTNLEHNEDDLAECFGNSFLKDVKEKCSWV